MKSCFAVLLLSFTACSAAAQWTGPAWNPHCYYPRVGNRAEIDTIFGNNMNAIIGSALLNLGPRPGQSYGTIAPAYPSGDFVDIPANDMFDGGPDFNLHKLHLNRRLNFHLDLPILKIGHFRDTYHNDILTSSFGEEAVIYWEDDAGNYDSLRRTLFASLTPDGRRATGYGWTPGLASCVHITSDSVYDVLCPMGSGPSNIYQDTLGVGLVPGGVYMQGKQDTIVSPQSVLIHPNFNADSSKYHRVIWDSKLAGGRGIASYDLLGNIFYTHIESGFALSSLGYHLTYDTVFSASSILGFRDGLRYPFEMHVFPKEPGDATTDLVFPMLVGREFLLVCLRGSSTFGEHRLSIDSAFILHSPSYHGASDFDGIAPIVIRDCGDMTGRGNHTLCVEYKTDPAYACYCFYELGTQLDDKIDMFYVDGPMQGGAGGIDTITANNDGLQDVIVGEDSRYPTDGGPDNGSIHILYGRRDIPTRAVRRSASTGALLALYPNPLHGTLEVLAFDPAEAGPAEIKVMDVMGRQVAAFHRELGRGYQSLVLSIPDLPSGEYEVHVFEHSQTSVAPLQISR